MSAETKIAGEWLHSSDWRLWINVDTAEFEQYGDHGRLIRTGIAGAVAR